MKKAEIILSLIALSAIVMKMCLIPGVSLLIVLTLSLLACFYFYFGFALLSGMSGRKMFKNESYKEIPRLRVVGAFATGIALSLANIGILFRFQSYPGALLNLAFSLFCMSVIIIISIIKYVKTKATYYAGILKRLVIYSAICLTVFLIPKKAWVEFMYRNRPAFVRVLEKSWTEPNTPALQDSLDAAWDKK